MRFASSFIERRFAIVKERYCVGLIEVDSLGTEVLSEDESRRGIVVGWWVGGLVGLAVNLEMRISGRFVREVYRFSSGFGMVQL